MGGTSPFLGLYTECQAFQMGLGELSLGCHACTTALYQLSRVPSMHADFYRPKMVPETLSAFFMVCFPGRIYESLPKQSHLSPRPINDQ